MIRAFIVFLLFQAHSCITTQHHTGLQGQEKETRIVSRIIDGDTFTVSNGDGEERIRLIGVDAPETRRSANKGIGYYGEESKAYLARLLSGGTVLLSYDAGKRDRYGRTLAYVYLPNGTFVNAELVKNGYATVLTVPPNVTFADEFVRLEREAKRKKRGLWK